LLCCCSEADRMAPFTPAKHCILR